MSQENVEIVRQAIEAFNEGDVEGSIADLAPEFEYVPTGRVPVARGCIADLRDGGGSWSCSGASSTRLVSRSATWSRPMTTW